MDERDSNVEKTPRRNRTASQGIRYRLADNVKRFRRARGYTQKELAEVCQVHKNYVSSVERGTVNISLANMEALATGLVCTEWELLK
jgi:transcriptional regulator with XRE-family HTH domain